MIPAGNRLARGILLAALLLCARGATAEEAEAAEIRYEDRLRMPSRSDPIRRPTSVHADLHTGEVFVTDPGRNRILVFGRERVLNFVMPGNASFTAPFEVAVGPEGHLYVLATRAGQRGIVHLDFDGRFLGDVVLTGLPEGTGSPRPASLALSRDGSRLAVVDEANHRLWITATDGRVVADVDLAEGLEPEEAQEQLIGHVDVYGDTIVLALPSQGKINLYDLEGESRGTVGIKGVGDCQTAFPVAAALDRDGDVVLIDNQRTVIMRWRPEGNRCLGQHSGIGQSPGALYRPSDITLDAEGSFYVSQGFEARIQRYVGSPPAEGAPASQDPVDEGDGPSAEEP